MEFCFDLYECRRFHLRMLVEPESAPSVRLAGLLSQLRRSECQLILSALARLVRRRLKRNWLLSALQAEKLWEDCAVRPDLLEHLARQAPAAAVAWLCNKLWSHLHLTRMMQVRGLPQVVRFRCPAFSRPRWC